MRHAMAMLVRDRYGLEHAQAVLGHRKIETTQICAQQTLARAAEVMQKLG